MKPQDVIEQLVGRGSGWDIQDTMAFSIYDPSKFPEAASAEIDFEKAVVNLYNRGSDSESGKVSQTFAIKATLEPYEAPDESTTPQ